jgi:hypothetical protein
MTGVNHTSAATTGPLLPCPFCGSKPVRFWTSDYQQLAQVRCENDDCFGPSTPVASVRDADRMWNRRISVPAQAPLSEAERHAIAHARYQVEHASPDNPDCHFDYELVLNLLHVIERSAQPPAAPVDTSARSDGKTIGEFYGDPGARCSAANGDALSIAETDREVMRQAIVEACDLLAERKYGNPARSPGHNARLVLERALSTGIPALPQEALRYAATKAVEAYRRAQSEGEVVIAMENLERALSPDEPRRSVTRPQIEAGAGPHPSQHHSQGE